MMLFQHRLANTLAAARTEEVSALRRTRGHETARLRAAVGTALVAIGTRLLPPPAEPPRRASPATPC